MNGSAMHVSNILYPKGTGIWFKARLYTSYKMMPLPKRFPREIADVKAASMTSSGMYYWMNEANGRNGKAMIIGPEDTPYAYCPLLFNIDCPVDYPFSSPTVTFLTSDGITRFHPNLYVGGKVCLSILGTWRGPSWVAAMTLSTVLSSIQSLLEKNPIVNEPGWEKYTLNDTQASDYAELIQFRLIVLSFRNLQRWKKGDIPHDWKEFEDVLEERGEELYEKICEIIRKKAADGEKLYDNVVYSMSGMTRWNDLLNEIGSVKLADATLKE
ncbi:MAG: ubiquitin-conjugating enzyme E2 [Bacteroidetes bacterium]|nr:ubiquitin-conjugating enzyme E2 [Bacteroidota bacterium]